MRDRSIQTMMQTCRGAGGRILLEAVLVAVMGVGFAFAANWISPQGLTLARNYFPSGTNQVVRRAVGPVTSAEGTRVNPTNVSSAQRQLAARLKQAGLQLIDGRRALQLFQKSRVRQGVIFIDARDESLYRKGHIPGAYEFDPYHPEKFFPVVLAVCRAAEQTVVYCNGGDCDDSETAAFLLRDVGIPSRKLFVYAGGISEWTNNRFPVETGARNSGNLRNVSP